MCVHEHTYAMLLGLYTVQQITRWQIDVVTVSYHPLVILFAHLHHLYSSSSSLRDTSFFHPLILFLMRGEHFHSLYDSLQKHANNLNEEQKKRWWNSFFLFSSSSSSSSSCPFRSDNDRLQLTYWCTGTFGHESSPSSSNKRPNIRRDLSRRMEWDDDGTWYKGIGMAMGSLKGQPNLDKKHKSGPQSGLSCRAQLLRQAFCAASSSFFLLILSSAANIT